MTLVSGPPREPQEREAAPEVVPNPGSCSWTREGKAGVGGGKMGGECQQGLLGGGRRGVAMVTGEGRGQVCCESSGRCLGRAGLGW